MSEKKYLLCVSYVDGSSLQCEVDECSDILFVRDGMISLGRLDGAHASWINKDQVKYIEYGPNHCYEP